MKYRITISREDDGFQGLTPIAQIIVNGLSCLIPDPDKTEMTLMSNAIEMTFEAEPGHIENAFDNMEEPDDDGPPSPRTA